MNSLTRPTPEIVVLQVYPNHNEISVEGAGHE
jgi:hypothetical protein